MHIPCVYPFVTAHMAALPLATVKRGSFAGEQAGLDPGFQRHLSWESQSFVTYC